MFVGREAHHGAIGTRDLYQRRERGYRSFRFCIRSELGWLGSCNGHLNRVFAYDQLIRNISPIERGPSALRINFMTVHSRDEVSSRRE